MRAARKLGNLTRLSLPVDFHYGATWVFWGGILIAICGLIVAFGGYAADQQMHQEISKAHVEAQNAIQATRDEAHRRILEVEESVKPRRLTEAQRLAFESLFRSKHGQYQIRIFVGQGAGEVAALQDDIIAALRTAGAKERGWGWSPHTVPAGVSFEANANNSEFLTNFRHFDSDLGAEYICQIGGAALEDDAVDVYIGARAAGLP